MSDWLPAIKNTAGQWFFCVCPVLLAVFALFTLQCPSSTEDSTDYQNIRFTTDDGAAIEGALFKAKKDRVVIFAHGAVFQRESWFPLARRLKRTGISSLAINFRGYGKSSPGKTDNLYYDILGAVNFIEKKGYHTIALVGGSMGAVAILKALAHKEDNKIDKVVLLAPPGGEPIPSSTIKKLFIVANGDTFYEKVAALYRKSAGPKQFKVFPGSAHAQHIFKGREKDNLTSLIIQFIRDDTTE